MTAAALPPVPLNDLRRHNAALSGEITEALRQVVESGWYVLAAGVREFERRFASYCGVDFCAGTASGTDALELALAACGAGPGNQVATTANAGGYATTAILATGAEPLYVDVDA